MPENLYILPRKPAIFLTQNPGNFTKIENHFPPPAAVTHVNRNYCYPRAETGLKFQSIFEEKISKFQIIFQGLT